MQINTMGSEKSSELSPLGMKSAKILINQKDKTIETIAAITVNKNVSPKN